MSYNLFLDYQNGRDVYANYGLGFPHHKIKLFHDIIRVLKGNGNCSVAIDELSVYWDSYSGVSKKDGTSDLKNLARQTRKRTVKLYYTAQTFIDVHRSLRRITQNVLVTRKLHLNLQECFDEFCYKDHLISITNLKIGIEKIYPVNERIFELYNSDEVVELDKD